MSVPPPDARSSEGSPPCPNCGQPWPENAPACPNCGFLRAAGSSWPPAPAGQVAGGPLPLSRLVTKSATGDILLGLGLSLLTFLLGVGIIAVPILYFALQRQYPHFARGMGFGWLGGMALLLGAVAVCIAAVNAPNGGL